MGTFIVIPWTVFIEKKNNKIKKTTDVLFLINGSGLLIFLSWIRTSLVIFEYVRLCISKLPVFNRIEWNVGCNTVGTVIDLNT